MESMFALYRLSPCLHELCLTCYPKINHQCPICRANVEELLQPEVGQIWELVKQYCNGPCSLELESFLWNVKLRKHFSKFLPLYVDRGMPVSLLLYCTKMCVSRYDLEFVLLAYEYNTPEVKFRSGAGCLHSDFDFIHKSVRLPDQEKLKRLHLRYGGIDLVKTKIETTDGYILNGIQWLVNNYWWVDEFPLEALVGQFEEYQVLLAAYSIETAENKDYAQYYDTLARKTSLRWLKSYYHKKGPIREEAQILYQLIRRWVRIEKELLEQEFVAQTKGIKFDYEFEELLDFLNNDNFYPVKVYDGIVSHRW